MALVFNLDFRFDSREHLNDHFDGEQLLYLADPENQFISSDRGYESLTNTIHGQRIHIVDANVLRDGRAASPYLETVIGGCTAARLPSAR